MKPKLSLCLALVLGGWFCFISRAETNVTAATHLVIDKLVTFQQSTNIIPPQESVHLPGLGSAIFKEDSSHCCLQIPIGSRAAGKEDAPANTNALDLQAWLLRTDGIAIPQSDKPTTIILGSIGIYSTDYMLYNFSAENELAGVVVSAYGKLYCHEIEMRNVASVSRDEDIFHISPTNISDSPVSVQVTNADSSERFTVLYKTDKAADKSLHGHLELSDGDSVITSEPVGNIWTTNGFKFEFNPGGFWRLKFKMVAATNGRDTAMPRFSGYWFYLRDFVANASMAEAAYKIIKDGDLRMGAIQIPGLNEDISFTEQPTQYTVQIIVASYRDHVGHIFPKVDELHRQVWLLRSDGTAIPQSQKPEVLGIGSGGYVDVHLGFTFRKKSLNEVAGVVVSVNGKLYCRELPSEWNEP